MPSLPSLRELPKAELHLHIEGTLEPELVFALAERNHIDLPFSSLDDLKSRYAFTDLQSFLDLYYSCMSVLITEQDFTDMAIAYFTKAHEQGVRHVEMFFDPEGHTERGVALTTVVEGLRAGFDWARSTFGITGGLIMCVLRHLPPEVSLATLSAMNDAYGHLIGSEWIGIGIDSTEIGNPASKHAEVFDRAATLGLHRVAHAGEEGSASAIWDALTVLHAERIDHGVHAVDDPALLTHLAVHRIPLTVCPLSNLRLRVVHELRDHPLPRLIDAGVVVTINSDDPAYFGGYIADNFAAIQSELGITTEQSVALAKNSIEASFASQERKSELIDEIEAWHAAYSA